MPQSAARYPKKKYRPCSLESFGESNPFFIFASKAIDHDASSPFNR